MRKRWTRCLMAMLLLACLPGAGGADDLGPAKERLEARLKQDQVACAKGLAKSALLGPAASFVAEVCKDQQNLARLVEQTPREELAAVLVNLFIDELSGGPTRGQYPPMNDYLTIFGAPAVAALMTRYQEVPEQRRGDILRTLGEIGSEKALPLVRTELKRRNPWTLSLAAYALRMIRKEAAKEELLPLLREPGIDAQAVAAIVRHLMSLEDPGWYGTVLELAQEKTIPFQTVTDFGSYDKYPEAVVSAHLDYLLARWAAGDSGTVACLLFQIHQRSTIKQWFPILEDLLRAKFGYPNRRYAPLTVRCQPFPHHGRHPLLERIENTLTLTDIEEWIHKPSPGWVSYLYLRELRQAKGGPPLDAGKLRFRLAISVYDGASDTLLGEVSDLFQSGVARAIELPADRSTTGPYRISLTPRLQKDIMRNDRWSIDIPFFIIDNPVGCGFPMTVAMESLASKRTSHSGYIQRRWQVRHIGAPPADYPVSEPLRAPLCRSVGRSTIGVKRGSDH